MHLTGTDLTIIGCMYAGAIALIAWLARTPRHLKTPAPRLHPLGIALFAAVMITLIGALVMVAFDPAAAAMFARLLD